MGCASAGAHVCVFCVNGCVLKEYYPMLAWGRTLVPGSGGGADWLQEHVHGSCVENSLHDAAPCLKWCLMLLIASVIL